MSFSAASATRTKGPMPFALAFLSSDGTVATSTDVATVFFMQAMSEMTMEVIQTTTTLSNKARIAK